MTAKQESRLGYLWFTGAMGPILFSMIAREIGAGEAVPAALALSLIVLLAGVSYSTLKS